jgi:hypothetical protein
MTIAAAAEAVFENEAIDAVLVEPKGVVVAFVRGEVGVAAARADDHGGPN